MVTIVELKSISGIGRLRLQNRKQSSHSLKHLKLSVAPVYNFVIIHYSADVTNKNITLVL